MKLPVSWLKEYVDINLPADKLSERISVSLTEVEKVVSVESELVLEIENKALTHRPDCFSVEGIAREISAITHTPKLIRNGSSEIPKPEQNLPLSVEVQNSTLCPRYSAVVIANIKLTRSPEYIQKRLRLSGVRPINNIVDITNYLMLETGQPLHSFDYDKLSPEKKIVVRTSYENEKVVTLDGTERKLDTKMLLITDPQKAIAVAGIMGAANSEITADSKTIVVESANFEHFNIRHTSLHLGLRTEASTRFEKGQDPEKTVSVLNEALRMYKELADGNMASEIIDIYANPIQHTVVEIDLSHLIKRLGMPISELQIEEILRSLEFEIRKNGTVWEIEAPSFRRDIHIEADILEEIARIYGYDKITPHLPIRDFTPTASNPEIEFSRKVKDTLAKLCLSEIYTYSFVNPIMWEKLGFASEKLITLKNPLSPELSAVRDSLIPQLLEKASLNTKYAESFGLYELNKIIMASDNKDLPKEDKKIGIVLYDLKKPTFFTLKGLCETFLRELGISRSNFNPTSVRPPYRAGEIAEIVSGEVMLGYIGNLSSEVFRYLNIGGYVSIAEFDFSALFHLSPGKKEYHALPKYPFINFDLSFLINDSVLIQDIVNAIQSADIQNLKEVKVFDVFADPKFTDNRKSVALHLTFGSEERTLTDAEIKPEIDKIEKLLVDSYNAQIRKE